MKGKSFISRNEISKQTGIELPTDIHSFLTNGVISKLKPKVRHLSYNENLSDYDLLSPICNPYKIICLAFNYSDQSNWIRFGKTPPEDPVIHLKPRTALTGPFQTVHCPSFVRQLDYEGELAVLINKQGKNIDPNSALDFIGGYFIMNDFSARDIQFTDTQLTRAKAFDTFGPCGPWITTSDEIKDPDNLKLMTKVNGKVCQNSSTCNQVLKVRQIISLLSKVMTLEPCDVICTGTPSGTALSLSTQGFRFLDNGDEVEVRIEKLGKIKNKIVINHKVD